MKNAGWILVLLGLGSFVGCKVEPPKQADEPIPGEVEAPEDVEDEEDDTPEPPAPLEDEPDAPDEDTGIENSEPPPEEAAEPPPSKPACADLKKGKCKITSGCAWNEIKKCVEE